MAAARDLDLLLPLIIYEAAKVVDADRCTLFILDREQGELWSKVAQGAAQEIRVKLGKGIAGTVADTGQVINITDAYADPRFNRDVDAATGYRTRTVLCVPMRDAQGEGTGVSRRSTNTPASSPTRTPSFCSPWADRRQGRSRTRSSTTRSTGSSRASSPPR